MTYNNLSDFKTNLEWALYYYEELGFNVIPLRAGTKVPALASWKSYQTERIDRRFIVNWWTRHPNDNIAVITGSISDLIVLDLDVKDKNGNPDPSLLADVHQTLADEGGMVNMPLTPTVDTWSRGEHLYFKGNGRTITKGKLTDHIDLQAERAYVVAPPSYYQHRGHRGYYRWHYDDSELGLMSPDRYPLEEIPEWLLTWIERLREKETPTQDKGSGNERDGGFEDTGYYVNADRDAITLVQAIQETRNPKIKRMLKGVGVHHRNEALHQIVLSFFARAYKAEDIYGMLSVWNQCGDVPWDDKEFRRQFEAVTRCQMRKVGEKYGMKQARTRKEKLADIKSSLREIEELASSLVSEAQG